MIWTRQNGKTCQICQFSAIFGKMSAKRFYKNAAHASNNAARAVFAVSSEGLTTFCGTLLLYAVIMQACARSFSTNNSK